MLGEAQRQRNQKAKQERPNPESVSQQVPQPHESPLNQVPPFPLATIPTWSPFPMGTRRAAASFVEVGVQPQLPRLPQGPGKREG